MNELSIDVDKCVDNVDNLLKTCDNGRIAKEGIRTVILGKTNAGKSSLLNALAKEERAIVTDIEGTTRDTLEEQITIGGIQLNLIDTAGIRDTVDFVESIGVEKAKKLATEADLVIFVVDSTRTLDENDKDIISLIQDKKVITPVSYTHLSPFLLFSRKVYRKNQINITFLFVLNKTWCFRIYQININLFIIYYL